jgi:hypothetical protein
MSGLLDFRKAANRNTGSNSVPQVLSITTDNFPAGTLIDIPWAPGKRVSQSITPAAELIAGTEGGKIAHKVAVQAAKMSLMAEVRKLGDGGRLLVVLSSGDGGAKGRDRSRLLMVRASAEPITAADINSPADLKTALKTRTPAPAQYIQHPTLGYGGRTIGVTQENNVPSHLAYYAFIDPTHTTITQFEASIDTEDGHGLTKDELEAMAEIVMRTTLGPVPEPEPATPQETPADE